MQVRSHGDLDSWLNYNPLNLSALHLCGPHSCGTHVSLREQAPLAGKMRQRASKPSLSAASFGRNHHGQDVLIDARRAAFHIAQQHAEPRAGQVDAAIQ